MSSAGYRDASSTRSFLKLHDIEHLQRVAIFPHGRDKHVREVWPAYSIYGVILRPQASAFNVPRSPQTQQHQLCRSMSGRIFLPLLLGISLLATAVAVWRHLSAKPSVMAEDFAICGNYGTSPCFGVNASPVEMVLEETTRYGTGTVVSEMEWLTCRSPWSHAGYVRVGEDHKLYGVAMIHQLHCVQMIARALPDPQDPRTPEPHITHCLQYLMQLFLCNADTTLEPYDFMTRNFTAHPVGMTRVCRDWEAVYAAAEDNYERWTAHW